MSIEELNQRSNIKISSFSWYLFWNFLPDQSKPLSNDCTSSEGLEERKTEDVWVKKRWEKMKKTTTRTSTKSTVGEAGGTARLWDEGCTAWRSNWGLLDCIYTAARPPVSQVFGISLLQRIHLVFRPGYSSSSLSSLAFFDTSDILVSWTVNTKILNELSTFTVQLPEYKIGTPKKFVRCS